MTPRQLILVFCLIIFALLTSMTADAQTHWAAKTGASEPTPTAAPAPTAIPEPTKAPTPTARPALPRARIYLPMLHTVQRAAGDSFWADRYRLQPGECTQIHWAVTNYPSPVYAVYLNDMPVTDQDTRWVCPVTTAQYVLRVVRSTGTEWYRVTITVSADSHPSIEFSADAYQIRRGECTILRWRVTGASAVYLNNVGVAGESSQQVCPEVDTSYELRVVSTDGATTTKGITISVVSADQAILHFWADQYTLAANVCTVLSWNVQNVREVYLDDQPVLGQGSKSVCPQPNQLYTVRGTDNAGDSIERSIKFFVGDPTLTGPEVIARGIVNDLVQAVDIDPGQPGEQPGYRLVIDGISPLFTGTPGWAQAVVFLGVPQSLTQSGQPGPVDWPIVPGQQVEFRAACDGSFCIVKEASAAYLRLRSE
jgi:hypothetical protein